jgi:hypothetical protein
VSPPTTFYVVTPKARSNIRDAMAFVTASDHAVDVPLRERLPFFVGNGLWVTSFADPDGYRLDFESPTDVPEDTKLGGGAR